MSDERAAVSRGLRERRGARHWAQLLVAFGLGGGVVAVLLNRNAVKDESPCDWLSISEGLVQGRHVDLLVEGFRLEREADAHLVARALITNVTPHHLVGLDVVAAGFVTGDGRVVGQAQCRPGTSQVESRFNQARQRCPVKPTWSLPQGFAADLELAIPLTAFAPSTVRTDTMAVFVYACSA